jgi:hypothetical protein
MQNAALPSSNRLRRLLAVWNRNALWESLTDTPSSIGGSYNWVDRHARGLGQARKDGQDPRTGGDGRCMLWESTINGGTSLIWTRSRRFPGLPRRGAD